MKGVVFTGSRKLEVREFPVPEPGEGEVLIDPTDLPSCVLLRLGPEPQLRLSPRGQSPCSTVIRGRFAVLLDLFAAELEGNRVSVSSLCIAAGVAPTTALRWIARMTDMGLEPMNSSAEVFRNQIGSELVKWRRVVREANIKAE